MKDPNRKAPLHSKKTVSKPHYTEWRDFVRYVAATTEALADQDDKLYRLALHRKRISVVSFTALVLSIIAIITTAAAILEPTLR